MLLQFLAAKGQQLFSAKKVVQDFPLHYAVRAEAVSRISPVFGVTLVKGKIVLTDMRVVTSQ